MSKKHNDEDVLDFINSLPDSKSTTPQPKGNENKEELFDFLDEIAQHKPKKFTPKKKEEDSEIKVDNEITKKETNDEGLNTEGPIIDQSQDHDVNEEKSSETDPISSLSNWWQSEGSNKVTSLWGSLTSNVDKITEQSYQFATSTTNQLNERSKKIELDDINSKLNNLVFNISSQIKQQLIDENYDEVLNIILVCDIFNLNYLQDSIYHSFNLAMNSVEGEIKILVNEFNHHKDSGDKEINLNMIQGKINDGIKLSDANIDNAISQFQKTQNDKEENETNDKDEKNDTKHGTNLFLSILAVEQDDKMCFITTVKDVTNEIYIINKSQEYSSKFASWLQGEKLSEEYESIDPKEWIKNNIKEGIDLSLKVLAQEYVIKRMGL